MFNWTLGNKNQWNLNRNLYIFIQENAFENVVWKMAAILSLPQCVNLTTRVVCSWGCDLLGGLVSIVPADALAPCISRALRAVVLTVCILVFHEGESHQLVQYMCQLRIEMIENDKYIPFCPSKQFCIWPIIIWKCMGTYSDCGFSCPGAKAPGHQHPQHWHYIHCIRSASYRNITSVGNNIRKWNHILGKKMTQLLKG